MNSANKVRTFFAENLKRIRKEKGITYEGLADCIGVSVSAVRQYEKALKLPGIDKIFEIANFLQVSVTALIGENDFSDNTPNVEKIVEDSVFEYRRQHAMEILKAAKCKFIRRKDKFIIFVPVKILTKDKTGGIEISNKTYDAEFSDILSAVELVEDAITHAANSNITLVDALLAKIPDWDSFSLFGDDIRYLKGR